ncbi:hypothetical protein BG004_002260 [Podila humilis]|nr:hypothetical protein BG004_002260 [Podila humilis]
MPKRVTEIRENHPFKLKSRAKNAVSLLLDRYGRPTLYEARDDPTHFTPVELCAVTSPDAECSRKAVSDCLYEGANYRIRVLTPRQGYIGAGYESDLVVVDHYERAATFSLHSVAEDVSFRFMGEADGDIYFIMGWGRERRLTVEKPFSEDQNHRFTMVAH